ncbi:MAG: hypothetical protein WD294_16530 [Phycisphaeraceae bacterium]
MRPLLTTAILLTAMLAAASCSAPRIQTTQLGSADLVVMTDAMVASLMNQDELAERNADAPRWVITLERVSNQTNDVLPQRELWAFMARLRAQLSQSGQLSSRNIAFVVPRAYSEQIGERHDAGSNRAQPTHALTATFYAATSRDRTGRTDTYLCAFQLLDLQTDELIWEDSYETKRAVARGRLD